MAAAYPPDEHLLRDLRLTFDHRDDLTSRAWMPVVPELCADDGTVRAGAYATLVDVIGGGLAAVAAQPDWIATADLTLHVARPVRAGTVEARARVLRAGRTTVVIEVALHADDTSGDPRFATTQIGLATMSFSVLPRRDSNPDIGSARPVGPSTMALPGSCMTAPYLERLGAGVVDRAAGRLVVPVTDWARNSLGALQGGAAAAVAEASAEVALRAAIGAPLVVTDLHVTYLSLNRVGPVETAATVLGTGPGCGTASVHLVDTGAGARLTTRATAVAGTWSA
jgi:uncharacterized protein (TIGR00369 family)